MFPCKRLAANLSRKGKRGVNVPPRWERTRCSCDDAKVAMVWEAVGLGADVPWHTA